MSLRLGVAQVSARWTVYRRAGGARNPDSPRARGSKTGLVCGLAIWLAPACAQAQLQLPGAVGGQSGASPPRESGAAPSPHVPPRPTLIKVPEVDTIIGQALKHDGTRGLMTFSMAGGDVVLSKLTFAGEKLSHPTESCSVDVKLDPPVVARALGRPQGAYRYDVGVALCPFVVDVLDGAVLVSPVTPRCEIAAADCRVAPTGLWGPAAADISPKRAKDMEHDRVRLETAMRSNFRALVARAGKDRVAVKAIARDQAAFSSDREVTCRDYDKESELGFCSTQITEARALALIAKFGPEAEKEAKAHARAKPKAPAATPPASGPTRPVPAEPAAGEQ